MRTNESAVIVRHESACRIPTCTYRLQLSSEFTVQNVIELLSYFSKLGIDSLYVSPILKARQGSPHGYDIVDHSSLNPEIGTAEEFRELGEQLRRFHMGLIVDIVPNHMCVADSGNWRWMDVLENGPSSQQACFFDIDWQPPRKDLQDKVLIPVLGDQYGRVLENGELRLEYVEGGYTVRYMEHVFPVAPRTFLRILEPLAAAVRQRLGPAHACVTELESIIAALTYLPLRSETDQARIRERYREKEIIKRRLANLVHSFADFHEALLERISRMNGVKGEPESFDELEHLLAEQAYRLSDWRVASDEINYRRFFDINDLAAVRVEDPAVFDAVHSTILEGVRDGWVTGLRVDHPDGLYDPALYFAELQRSISFSLGRSVPASSNPGFYVVAEKIMGSEERPRRDWAVHGTTGYGFLNEVGNLFVDNSARAEFDRIFDAFTGDSISFSDIAYECKRLILRSSLSSELTVLSRRLDRICQQHRHTRDLTLESVRSALVELIACFPVYRTYISENQTNVEDEDRVQIRIAVNEAKRRNAATSASIFDALESILLLHHPPGLSSDQIAERRVFVMRFQQLTGPVMAKGVEDTAFYRQFPLASLNEVGGDPQVFGLATDDFHAKVSRRASYWPHNLLATSTHDTKRSEDVRARLNVLSEIPSKWRWALEHWSNQNSRYKSMIDGQRAPAPATEYLLYQTLVGLWPLEGLATASEHRAFTQRIQDYMQKALREGKMYTSWINPNASYEIALRDFIAAVLHRDSNKEFVSGIESFSRDLAIPGIWNSLAQTVLKMTCPGVPDIFQGTELWDFSLVDPDNRRPVDYGLRARLLSEMPIESEGDQSKWLSDSIRTLQDGRLKLYVIARIARFRRANPQLFKQSTYVPLELTGERREHVVAFARSTDRETLVVAVSRFFTKLGCPARIPTGEDVWQNTQLNVSSGFRRYRDLLSAASIDSVPGSNGTTLPVSRVFSVLPLAVLVSET